MAAGAPLCPCRINIPLAKPVPTSVTEDGGWKIRPRSSVLRLPPFRLSVFPSVAVCKFCSAGLQGCARFAHTGSCPLSCLEKSLETEKVLL